MINLFLQYFSAWALKIRIGNRKISLLSMFDKSSKIHTTALVNRFSNLKETRIGRYSYIGPNCSFTNVEIGSFCSISKNVNIGFYTHPINFISTSPLFFSPTNGTGSKWVNVAHYDGLPNETHIGNDVWIGANSSVMGGVNVGNGSIIGAHSLVTKDVEPYSIVGGVPARLIKKRFSDEIINDLQLVKWWDMNEEKLQKYVSLFSEEVTIDKLKILANDN